MAVVVGASRSKCQVRRRQDRTRRSRDSLRRRWRDELRRRRTRPFGLLTHPLLDATPAAVLGWGCGDLGMEPWRLFDLAREAIWDDTGKIWRAVVEVKSREARETHGIAIAGSGGRIGLRPSFFAL